MMSKHGNEEQQVGNDQTHRGESPHEVVDQSLASADLTAARHPGNS